MRLQYFYEFLFFYIVSIIYEYAVYFMVCSNFELKISKKRAYVSAFFYANFLTVTNTLSNIIIARKLIDETLPVIIITKLTTIIGELLIILFLSKTLHKVWYQIYWLTIILHIILTIPIMYYLKVFVYVDSEERIIYQAVNGSNLLQYLLSIGIMLLAYTAIWYLVRLIAKRMDLNKISKKLWVGIYTVWISFVLLTLKTYQYSSDASSKKIVGFDNYREAIIILLVIGFFLAIAIIHTDQMLLKLENKLLKEQNELQYANYLAIQQKDLEIHKLYHDIGNHINMLQILVEQGDTQEARDYTKKLTEQYQSIKKQLYCNNKIINAVLIQKLRDCEQNGIRYELELNLPQLLPVEDIDLMCIYSNLLDNAIESCQRNSDAENYIKIKTTQVGNYLGIKIVNSKAAEEVIVTDPEKRTTSKKDKKLHGYGLRIIDEIVKRYEGYKELKDDKAEFSAMVMLKLIPKEED
jgi:hypothetical protein